MDLPAHARHHEVEGPECRITRLPVGYAEGVLRLSFIAHAPNPGSDAERSRQRSRINVRTGEQQELHFLSGTGTYEDDGFSIVDMNFERPADDPNGTYGALAISYDTGQPTTTTELVDLAPLGA